MLLEAGKECQQIFIVQVFAPKHDKTYLNFKVIKAKKKTDELCEGKTCNLMRK